MLPIFWWLNNGVTILATAATVPGKTIQLQDIQIVNGLQTTETIFRHFRDGAFESRDRCLLVKIVVSSDARARDQIIRATNNQSPVEVAALHATDKVQRDIEEILERYNWFYERRRNYYRNTGKPEARLVTPIYLASAVVSLVFRNPSVATRLKAKFMRNQESYAAVFSSEFPIELWPVLIAVYKFADRGLLALVKVQKRGERFLSSWRPLVSLLLAARALGKFSYSIPELTALNVEAFGTDGVAQEWDVIATVQATWELKRNIAQLPSRKGSFSMDCCKELARRNGIPGVEQIGRRGLTISQRSWTRNEPAKQRAPVTADFIAAVDFLLPAQPWKPGIHREVAAKLSCHHQDVTAAIQQLIADGKRCRQENGVVLDNEGRVLIIDEERLRAGETQSSASPANEPAT